MDLRQRRPQRHPGYITATDYEADGQTRQITYANGVVTAFAYSPTRRWLTRIMTTRPGVAMLFDNIYTRDLAGRITAINGLAATDDWTYSYNHLDWLLTADNAGNNALDETFAYAANGNLLSRTRLAGAFTYPAGTGVRPHAPVKAWPQHDRPRRQRQHDRRWYARAELGRGQPAGQGRPN